MAAISPTPEVTIGLPVRNAAATLEVAILSVLSQTFQSWRLLVVDDGSTDRTREIAKAFSRHDSRIELIQGQTSRGLAARLNEISALSETPYLARMDGDDIMHPARLQRQVEVLESNPGIDLVSTGAYVIDSAGRLVGKRIPQGAHTVAEVLRNGGLFIHPTVTARTEWFRQNPYDEALLRCQDLDLWCRIVEQRRWMILNEPLLFYREDLTRTESYRRSVRARISVVRRYGEKHLGMLGTSLLLAKLRFRALAVIALSRLGFGSIVRRGRNRSPESSDFASADRAMALALAGRPHD